MYSMFGTRTVFGNFLDDTRLSLRNIFHHVLVYFGSFPPVALSLEALRSPWERIVSFLTEFIKNLTNVLFAPESMSRVSELTRPTCVF